MNTLNSLSKQSSAKQSGGHEDPSFPLRWELPGLESQKWIIGTNRK